MKKEIISLVKKLLKRIPTNVPSGPFDSCSITYNNDDFTFYIDLYTNIDSKYMLSLHINNHNISQYNDYQFEIGEKDYMEIKWKIEEWSNYLKEQAFNKFKEFIEEDDTQIDDLLDD